MLQEILCHLGIGEATADKTLKTDALNTGTAHKETQKKDNGGKVYAELKYINIISSKSSCEASSLTSLVTVKRQSAGNTSDAKTI